MLPSSIGKWLIRAIITNVSKQGAYNFQVRIIAGELKGREVQIPRQSRIRPATGFIRELAMNLFTPRRIEGGVFLDLCAGSGLVALTRLLSAA